LEKKQRRAEYFSNANGATSLKRRATNEPEEAPPRKRVKREYGYQEVMGKDRCAQEDPKNPPKKSEMTPEAARPTKPRTALEKLASRQANVEEHVKTQAETDEDREIAWLELKLGIKGKSPKSKTFEEDGLDGMLPKSMS
jgi:hypothetical protein